MLSSNYFLLTPSLFVNFWMTLETKTFEIVVIQRNLGMSLSWICNSHVYNTFELKFFNVTILSDLTINSFVDFNNDIFCEWVVFSFLLLLLIISSLFHLISNDLLLLEFLNKSIFLCFWLTELHSFFWSFFSNAFQFCISESFLEGVYWLIFFFSKIF